ncbi:MAG TPA: HAD hydrolase-like protein [Acidimicrobiales bacterium]|nr:HAD hydrolase-like protein [Acidimicrobiales bacterium]
MGEVRRLVLWDVDGTLIRAGISAAVFDVALEAVIGRRPSARVRMGGKTDPQIVREYLQQMGVDETPGVVEEVLGVLEGQLAAAAATGELVANGSACPGVAAVLEALDKEEAVVCSLLTGNVHPNALVKVAAFGLERWLSLDVGAYGSDHADRDELVPIALSRLWVNRGVRLDPPAVWVVGDTPRDLRCARAAGARCLLVATGRHPLEELAALGADAVFPDLSDTRLVVDTLLG